MQFKKFIFLFGNIYGVKMQQCATAWTNLLSKFILLPINFMQQKQKMVIKMRASIVRAAQEQEAPSFLGHTCAISLYFSFIQ